MKNSAFAASLAEREVKEKEGVGQRRKKIWQIPSSYHCSVIGSCLSRNDLKKIAAKKSFGFESNVDDFTVHRNLSAIAATRLPKTRALHKMLDLKYKAAIKRYDSLVSDGEILEQWRKDLQEAGNIAGAYWAVLTHPVPSDTLIDQVYGDCHMISYDIFSSYRRDVGQLRLLRRKIETLETKVEKNRNAFKREKENLRKELCQLQRGRGELLRQRLQAEKLQEENQALKNALDDAKVSEKIESLTDEVARLQALNKEMKEALLMADEKADDAVQLLDLAEQSAEEMQQGILELEVEKLELQEEITSLEEMFRLGMDSKKDCDDCAEKLAHKCQGLGLSGKTVLYVGGRKNMISHYREMVEKHGGVFLHHDGGKESSRNLLPRMLSGADAVLCPIDCVSHDACKCVKKICKRNSKPFVMMRSSGLSSLAKGLGSLVQ